MADVDRARAEGAVRELLIALGHDPDSAALRGTPARVVEHAATAWPGAEPLPQLPPAARLAAEGDALIALEAIPFRSVCEHHLLPFSGTVSIVYQPGEWIVGIGRLVQLVDATARRLQLQERLVEQIAGLIETGLRPRGVLVRLRATHSCLWARGIGREGTELVTSAARGLLAPPDARAAALAAIGAAS